MISKELIERINILSRKSKSEGLTEKEEIDQTKLRQEYLDAFKKNFEVQLQSIEFVNEDKTKTPN